MTGNSLQILNTSLMNGQTIPTTLFYSLLNIARSNREMNRPWAVLKKKDTSQSATPGDTYLTAKTLPADFRRLLLRGSVRLFDGGNDIQYYNEIPFEEALEHKDDAQSFFIDHANKEYFLTGVTDKAYQIYMYYIANFGDITDTTEWLKFPSEFHPILAFDVAEMYRNGVDWDDISYRNATGNAIVAARIWESMQKWDEQLILSQIENIDYSSEVPWRSGRVTINQPNG